MTFTITARQLKRMKACDQQLDLFREKFGDRVTFKSRDDLFNAIQENRHDFDFAWVSSHLLDNYTWLEFMTIREVAHKKYLDARNSALADALWKQRGKYGLSKILTFLRP